MHKQMLGLACSILLLVVSSSANAGTYRCVQGGKTIYSDVPCAHDASRVDAGADSVDRRQRREAENVNYRTQNQLRELQYEQERAKYSAPRAAQFGGTGSDRTNSQKAGY